MTISYRPLVHSKGFKFGDNFTYANGNLQDHPPWAYRFPGGSCATLIGFIVNNQFEMAADTQSGHWSTIVVSTAPYKKTWDVSAKVNGFTDTNQGKWAVGIAIFSAPGTVLKGIGIAVNRVVNGGALTLIDMATNESPGICAIGGLNLSDPTVAVGDTLRIVSAPSGANDYNVSFYKNGVFLQTNNYPVSANIGAQPCFLGVAPGGTEGKLLWDNFTCKEAGAVNTFNPFYFGR